MRMLSILAVTIAALGAMPANAAHYVAGGAPYGGAGGPWCAYYDAYSYNCGFATLAQCRATISGVGGFCWPNPYGVSNPYGAPVQDDRRLRRRHTY